MMPNTPPGLSACPPVLTPPQAAWERTSKKYAHSSGLTPINAAATFGDSGSRSHRNDIVVDFRLTGSLSWSLSWSLSSPLCLDSAWIVDLGAGERRREFALHGEPS